MKYFILFLFAAALLLTCKKADNTPVATVKGNITLTVTAQHHYWVIPGLPVYLKSNATEFPGTNTASYNASTTTNQGGDAQFKTLTFGNYYLYARGWDPIFADTVYGHIPVVVDSSTAGGNLVYVTMFVIE